MSIIQYKSNLRFGDDAKAIIVNALKILNRYEKQRIKITARGLHYQFVTQNFYANTQENYKRLCEVINRAKLAGLVSWTALEDITRDITEAPHWVEPGEFMTDYARWIFKLDMWDNQEYRPYVLVEKDAVVGVIESVCRELRVPFMSCRGYASGTALWQMGQKLQEHVDHGQTVIVFHLGDHDPSGLDMTRDNRERLSLFAGSDVEIVRLALNRDQVDLYQPPPNFAKLTDGRSPAYIAEHGEYSWELDALEPTIMSGLIRSSVEELIDTDRWADKQAEEKEFQSQIALVGTKWDKAIRAVSK